MSGRVIFFYNYPAIFILDTTAQNYPYLYPTGASEYAGEITKIGNGLVSITSGNWQDSYNYWQDIYPANEPLPNGFYCCHSSITETENPNFSMYPNPAQGTLTIEMRNISLAQYQIRIWDMQGQEKLDISSPNNSIILNMNDWDKGLYFVEVRDAEGSFFTEKFVKE